MDIINKNIDGGKAFDWGKTSADYAKYRDIYPQEFYDKIISRNLCVKGQSVLDIGTGTGVLPRNLCHFGAKWTGIDISEEQINQAEILSQGKDIDYFVFPAEAADFPSENFDVVTACQCFFYFDHKKLLPNLYRMLKKCGKLLILYMAWLPYEDKIASETERLILKYNPVWSGAGERCKPIKIPECYNNCFYKNYHEEFRIKVHFTRESWLGRIKACRGIGASLDKSQILEWENEHNKLISDIAPEEFDIMHYGAICELEKK